MANTLVPGPECRLHHALASLKRVPSLPARSYSGPPRIEGGKWASKRPAGILRTEI
jgi:hypothetical protein